jgi:hypothetical protein
MGEIGYFDAANTAVLLRGGSRKERRKKGEWKDYGGGMDGWVNNGLH